MTAYYLLNQLIEIPMLFQYICQQNKHLPTQKNYVLFTCHLFPPWQKSQVYVENTLIEKNHKYSLHITRGNQVAGIEYNTIY